MTDVFVSYASQDRAIVQDIVERLKADGLSVWWDRAINVGQAFDREIEQALDSAACIIVIWSKSSVDSDWVRAEAYEGLNRGLLIPVCIDNVRPPLPFRQTQSISGKEKESILAAVRVLVPENARADVTASPRVRYCQTSDGTKIAYAVQGTGVPLVRCLNWATCVTLDLAGTSIFTSTLAKNFKTITYDGRGVGLSQRGIFEWSSDERLDDLKSTIDATKLDGQFALLGISEGAATTIRYTVENPERVSSLVLSGPGLPLQEASKQDGIKPDNGWFQEFVYKHWGTEDPLARGMLCAAWSSDSSEDEQIAFMRQMRESMSPDTVLAYLKSMGARNRAPGYYKSIWEAAGKVQVPTLILHSIRDPLSPYEVSQRLAKTIPDAELVPLKLRVHSPSISNEFSRIAAEEIRRFVSNLNG